MGERHGSPGLSLQATFGGHTNDYAALTKSESAAVSSDQRKACTFSGRSMLPSPTIPLSKKSQPTPGERLYGRRSSATTALTLLIRSGRSAEYKRGLVMRLWELVQFATGAADDQIVIGIHEVPSSQAMEMRQIMQSSPNSRLGTKRVRVRFDSSAPRSRVKLFRGEPQARGWRVRCLRVKARRRPFEPDPGHAGEGTGPFILLFHRQDLRL